MRARLTREGILAAALAAAVGGCALKAPPTTGELQKDALPQTGAYPQVPGRFPVKFEVAEKDREQFLAAGADGAGAIYTEHVHAIHILRMVILRVGTITDYLVLKLH